MVFAKRPGDVGSVQDDHRDAIGLRSGPTPPRNRRIETSTMQDVIARTPLRQKHDCDNQARAPLQELRSDPVMARLAKVEL
mmetsp:Transcript_542/g.3847  ORF Transcript_542/g.3847 Transcript_542/m.3847 type:complete len:81 (-) Transcript_542:2338-2580(-)